MKKTYLLASLFILLGKYKEDKVYPLYIQTITCSFELKKNKIPTIQMKSGTYNFKGNEYLTSSYDKVEDEMKLVTMTMTNIDLKLFLENYDVKELSYDGGWKFKAIKGLFKDYIDKWIEVKIRATKEGNLGLRAVAKLQLNSLYGKFAKMLEMRSKKPIINDEKLKFQNEEKEEKDGIYIPVATFITAYAREKTIRTSQAIKEYSINKYGKDLYCYSDTDSIHTLLSIEELEKFCDIDDTKLRILEK